LKKRENLAARSIKSPGGDTIEPLVTYLSLAGNSRLPQRSATFLSFHSRRMPEEDYILSILSIYKKSKPSSSCPQIPLHS